MAVLAWCGELTDVLAVETRATHPHKHLAPSRMSLRQVVELARAISHLLHCERQKMANVDTNTGDSVRNFVKAMRCLAIIGGVLGILWGPAEGWALDPKAGGCPEMA